VKGVLGELRVTLYDIFGYLVPGLVALTGVAIFFWAVFVPNLKPDVDLKGVVWTALLLIAYVLGHLLQAVANNVPGFAFPIEQKWREDRVAGPFQTIIKAKLEAKDLLPDPADAEPMYRICDEVVVQKGETSERELYTYREGFYRAMAVALVLLAFGLTFRLASGPASITVDKPHEVTRAMLAFFVVVVLAGVVACYGRYVRFARYRARTVLLGAPIILGEPAPSPPRKTP